MKPFIARLVIALVAFAVATAVLAASRLERRAASAHHMLATLQYAEPVGEYGDIERSGGSGIPWVNDSVVADVRAHHATANYWLAQYAALAPARDTGGAIIPEDPHRLFLAANAAFREAQHATGDRAASVKRLDNILKIYTEALKIDPANVDAAYNFEYVARLRDRLVNAKGVDVRLARDSEPEPPSDLPGGSTLHGQPGGYPPGGGRVQIKVVVPMRPDERQDQRETDPGSGSARTRRG